MIYQTLKDKTNFTSPHLEGLGEAVLSSAYLAPIEYYVVLTKADKIFLESYDHYIKQTYRNRCRIGTSSGTMDLSIPIEKTSGEKQFMRDVRISYFSDWQQQHWRSIESAYNSTPFFEYYRDDFLPFYEKKWNFLWDFNFALQEKVLELIDIKPDIQLTTEYKTNWRENILDLREKIHPKKEFDFFESSRYYRVFEQKTGFIPNLSIIDLLFNVGNETILILNKNKLNTFCV